MADTAETQDLQKMKVADLKTLLKERGLPTAGNKADLITRLLEAGDATEEPEVEELDENVLNEDDDDIGLEEDVKEPAAEDKDNELVKDLVSENGDKTEKTEEKSTVVKLEGLDESQRVQQRAQRFGAVSEVSKKAIRAERFGTSQPQAKDTKDSGPIAAVPTTDYNKLKSRAERFGTAVSSVYGKVESVEKMKKRAERFGQVTSGTLSKVDSDVRIEKRKERFGAITAAGINTDEQAKKKLRAERFESSK